MNCDLHTHSTASDGALSPTALLERAVANGVDCLALTDHGSTDGVAELAEAASRASEWRGEWVAGVEISAGFEFDVPVRFDTDRINVSVASFRAGHVPDVPVVEVRV